MTWLGNSFLNLKDQITTLTREVLAEADEETEQPKFIPAEKFNRLLRICEEKEDQICLLQQEIIALRSNESQATPSLAAAERAAIPDNDGNFNAGENDAQSQFFYKKGDPQEESKTNRDREKRSSPTTSFVADCSSSTGDELNSDGKQMQYALRKIENLGEKNRLHHSQFALKEVKSVCEAEKSLRPNENCGSSLATIKEKTSTSVISLPSSKNSHGTDETMSNDSERSDDSLLNDFEILKPRNSCKRLDEFALSNNVVMLVPTRQTCSTATQYDYEFSVIDKNTQTRLVGNEADAVNVGVAAVATAVDVAHRPTYYVQRTDEFEQLYLALRMNSKFWEEVFLLVKSASLSVDRDVEDDVDDGDGRCSHESKEKGGGYEENFSTISQRQFWIELNDTVSKNNETLKHFVIALIDENELWKQFYQSLNENEEKAKHTIKKLMERESSLEESIRLRNTTTVKHVDELNTYSKKLENFNCSLNEVSDEILDQTVQLGFLYEELKSLNETKDALRKENARLTALVEKLEAESASNVERCRQVNLGDTAAVHGDDQPNVGLESATYQLNVGFVHPLAGKDWQEAPINESPSFQMRTMGRDRTDVDVLELEKGTSSEELRYENLLNEYNRLTSQCSDLKEQLCKCANEIDSLKNEAAEWRNYYEEERKECCLKDDQIARLTQQAETFKYEMEFLNSSIADVQTHCERLREEAALKDARMLTPVDDNARYEEEIAFLRGKIAQLEASGLRTPNEDSETTDTQNKLSNEVGDDDLRKRQQREQEDQVRYLTNRIDELTLCRKKLEDEVASNNKRMNELTEQIRWYDSEIEVWKSRSKERMDGECADADSQVDLLTESFTELEALKCQLERTRNELASRDTYIVELSRQSDAKAEEIRTLTSTIRFVNKGRDELRRNLVGILQLENECGRRQLLNVIEAVEKYALLVRQELLECKLVSGAEGENENENELDEWRNLVERAQGVSIAVDRAIESNTAEAMAELNSRLQHYQLRIGELETRITELDHSLAMQTEHRETLKNTALELENKLSVVTSERDEVIASLKDKHSENLYYHKELQKVHLMFTNEVKKNGDNLRQIETLKQQLMKNSNAEAELERLREHLLSTEQSYTNELLCCEEQIKDLQFKLNEYEERVKSINAAQTSVNVRANQVTESLQNEMRALAEENDKLTINLKHCQEELRKNIQDAQNLRSALDLFRRNKDSEVFQATEKLQNDVKILQNENRILNETILLLQSNLKILKTDSSETNELRDQVERKIRRIDELEAQIQHLQVELTRSSAKIVELKANTENTFKLNLLKNIVLRYITSSTDSMRSQALQILAEVLDFSVEEKRKIKLPVSGVDGSTKNDSLSANHSLIDEFIRFVEKESVPKDRCTPEKKTNIPPNILFTSPSSLPDVMLPTLSQLPVGQNSRHILKDVLQ